MLVTVLHHGGCFDGAASAAVFAAFFRGTVDRRAELRFVAKHHRQGDPYDAGDFRGEVAVVDFRYTEHPALHWFFDHHRSAFQLPGQREHFERRLLEPGSERLVYDPEANSCTGLMARATTERFGFDAGPHRELIAWAEVIDRAGFRDAREAVELGAPALRLMAFVEHNRAPELTTRFIEDLARRPIGAHAAEDYVTDTVQPLLARMLEQAELFRHRCRLRGGVAEFDLLDLPDGTWNKFLPYYHHPEARYAVGLGRGPDGCIRLTAGYNPWLPATEREHDVAALCERVGGGGHAYVGGASFFPNRTDAALSAKSFIAATLRGDRESRECRMTAPT